MGVETQQLADIFQEVGEVFAQHPLITVIPVKGDPPEQYEVNYKITGVYKDEKGKIQQSSNHTVIITIPFGFPHFPPSCKPKTALFHPDFDPAAICLGDFWDHERSLVDLIHYIGKMIAGEIYSKENTFNEEAAIWYKENSDKLPFIDSSTFNVVPKQDKPSPPSASLANEIAIDTLDDSDFSSDFNYLGLEKETPAEKLQSASGGNATQFQEAEAEPDIDIETIWLLSRQKRFHHLKSFLKDLPSETDFEGKEELTARIETVFSEARQIYAQGESFEHQGLPGKALDKYLAVEQLVSDYPKIQDDIRRTEQSKELLGDWVQGNGDKGEEKPKGPEKDKKTKQTKDKKIKEKPPGKAGGPTFYDEKSKRHLNIVPWVTSFSILFITLPLAYFYLSTTNRYNEAEKLFGQCSDQFKAKQFEIASKSCNAALNLSKDILFLKKQARNTLNEQIDALLNSEEMRQGLAGFVLLDGKYMPKNTADNFKSSQKAMKEGDKFLSESKWQEAIDVYAKSLNSLPTDSEVDASLRSNLEKKIHLAKARQLMQAGSEAMLKNQWSQAQQNFEGALSVSKNLDFETQQDLANKIKPQLDKCTFLVLKQKGDELFARSDWTGAFSHFQEAMTLGTNLEQSETQVLSSLQGDIIRAELYSAINEGKLAFSNGEWDEAIKKYAKASKILMDNQGLLNQTDLAQNRQKLTRIMLQASILRDQQKVTTSVEENDWDEAIKSIQLIIDAISKSPAGAEQEFQTALAEARKTLGELKEKQFIAEKIKYLENNFQMLFSENYPAAAPDTLTKPVISYIKEMEDKLLFKLQCTETGRGRPLNLVMFYTYSKGTKSWAFYSNTE